MVAVRHYPPKRLRLRNPPASAPHRSASRAATLSHHLSDSLAALEPQQRRKISLCSASLLLLFLLTRPPPPPPITGVPASHLFSADLPPSLRARYTAPVTASPAQHARLPPLYSRPATYFNRNARFLFYTAAYGQFNNQLVSLVNALLIARRLDAVLVLPYVRLGKESKWDAATKGLEDEMRVTRQLVGDYFNYSRLLTAEHVVQPPTFFHSPDGRDFLDWRNLTVAYRAGGYYRQLVKYASRDVLHRKRVRPTVLAPEHDRVRLDNFCDMSAYSLLRTVNEQGRNGRFVLLPVVFRRHNLNCSEQERRWVSVRSNLVPRDEFVAAVDRRVASLPHPILALHLRLFLNGDMGNFTARSFVDMLFRDYGTQLADANSVFVAYSPSSNESVDIVSHLRNRFHGVVADGLDFHSYFDGASRAYASLTMSAVLFDLWVCVRSHTFVGRLGSSLSWNVVYWRQALWKELGLERRVVQNPLWYELENFTTRGMSRKEGPVEGVQLARE